MVRLNSEKVQILGIDLVMSEMNVTLFLVDSNVKRKIGKVGSPRS